MEGQTIDKTQAAFRALADPTRREILQILGDDQMTIGEIADHFTMTRPAVKKHLGILEEGRLITVQRRGRTKVNRLAAEGLEAASEWLSYFDRFWDQRLNKLRSALTEEKKRDSK